MQKNVFQPTLHANVVLRWTCASTLARRHLSIAATAGDVHEDPKFQVLAKLLVELLVVISQPGNFHQHDKILLDHAQDLVLLHSHTKDVQREKLRFHSAFDKNQPLWN